MIEIPDYLYVELVKQNSEITTQCCNCSSFLAHPIRLQPCNHVVCIDCSLKYYDNCPKCQSIITSADNDKILQQQLLKLDVQCKCGEQFTLQDYIQHIKTCEQALISCPNGCKALFTSTEKLNHINKLCVLRMVSCENCGTITQFQSLANHLQSCQKVQINCQFCNISVLRQEMDIHLSVCPEVGDVCPLCQKQMLRKNLQEHLGSQEALPIHLLSLHQNITSMQTQFQQLHSNLSQKLTKVDQKLDRLQQKMDSRPVSEGKSERSQPMNPEKHVINNNIQNNNIQNNNSQEQPQIRTSLRFVPNVQDIGTDRVNSIMLLIPDELVANNQYQITTVPPTQKCILEIEDKLKGRKSEVQPTVKRNSVSFEICLEAGEYKFNLKQDEHVVDDQDVIIQPQKFIFNTQTIGKQQERFVSHNFLCHEPVRNFLETTQNTHQKFILNISRLNCFMAIGVTNNKSRRLSQFKMLCNDGSVVQKNGSISKIDFNNKIDLKFKQGDKIQIIIEDSLIKVKVLGKDNCWQDEWDDDSLLFVEAVDAEAVLL
ncbi:Conserved_hypothetical protein [Hexamita inflata]|uniref:Uncharacterized protein n=1 Tax=Hexamita inflata TaxID=28002 RepID=A0AA86TQU0_9EUKA|nr:Conserved hypothetical protein [Hexamita inflata]